MPNLTDAQWERVTSALDQLANVTTSLTVMTTVAADLHVSALRVALPDVVAQLTDLVAEVDPAAC